jgi:hypothetical protein
MHIVHTQMHAAETKESMMGVQSTTSITRRAIGKALLLGVTLSFFRLSQAMANATFTLEQIAGEYYFDAARLTIRADGRFDLDGTYFSGGDVRVSVAASGWFVPEAGAFAVRLDFPQDAGGLLPPKFHAVGTPDAIFLLSDQQLNWIINEINGYGRRPLKIAAMIFFHRLREGATNSDAIHNIDPVLLLPGKFANRILSTPLWGKVLSEEKIGQTRENMALHPPPIWKTKHISRLVVNLGSEQAVFEGMALYVSVGSSRRMGLVQKVMPDRCEMHLGWFEGGEEPKVGASVSSKSGPW